VRKKGAVIFDRAPSHQVTYPRKELVPRLLARRCELCGEPGQVAVHQVRKLAHLGGPSAGQPAWAALMAKRRRKTLVVCHPCHDAIHDWQPTAQTA
jgi:hypothetical protein